MARTLEEIMSTLEPAYGQNRAGIQTQISDIAGQREAALQNLNQQYAAQQQQLEANRDIYNRETLNAANARGLGWSNIASNYRGNYERSNYTPAVTDLQNRLSSSTAQAQEDYTNRQRTLENTLNQLYGDQTRYAQQLQQAELDREAQERMANAQNAAMATYFPKADTRPYTTRLKEAADNGSREAAIALAFTGDDELWRIDPSNPDQQRWINELGTGNELKSILNMFGRDANYYAVNPLTREVTQTGNWWE